MFVLIVLVVVTLAIVATWVVEWRRRRSRAALASTLTHDTTDTDPRGHEGVIGAEGHLR